MTTPTPPLSERDRRTLTIEQALRRAFSLGQTYWQQADSDSYSQNKKSDETRAKFEELVANHLAAPQPPSSPATKQREPAYELVREMFELADNWPGIAYTEALTRRVEEFLSFGSAPSPAVDAGVEADAKRYRWLREAPSRKGDDLRWLMVRENADSYLDAAIDAALAATPTQEEQR